MLVLALWLQSSSVSTSSSEWDRPFTAEAVPRAHLSISVSHHRP